MTDAVSLKPDLGRFGAWLPTRSITPELAAQIEALGYGAVWIGGSPDADLAWVEPALAQTSSRATGHRDRQHLVGAGNGRRRILSAHRKRLPGKVFARHRGGPPRAHPGVRQALRRTGRLPRRTRRRAGADQPAGARRARAPGVAAVGRTQRRRSPVSDHAGAHGQGARTGRATRCSWRRSTRWCSPPTATKPGRSAADTSSTTWA